MKYIQDAIYGGVDGILSAFNFLIIMQSAQFPKAYILIILILKLLSDALSLSLSNYSGNATQNEIHETLEAKAGGADTQITPRPSPYVAGAVTLLGFLVFGSIPILIYHFVLHDASNIWISAAIILATLFVLGSLKSLVIFGAAPNALQGGAHFTFVGMIGILGSILIGSLIHRIAGHKYSKHLD